MENYWCPVSWCAAINTINSKKYGAKRSGRELTRKSTSATNPATTFPITLEKTPEKILAVNISEVFGGF
jgi:hypothetical protein